MQVKPSTWHWVNICLMFAVIVMAPSHQRVYTKCHGRKDGGIWLSWEKSLKASWRKWWLNWTLKVDLKEVRWFKMGKTFPAEKKTEAKILGPESIWNVKKMSQKRRGKNWSLIERLGREAVSGHWSVCRTVRLSDVSSHVGWGMTLRWSRTLAAKWVRNWI